LVLALLFSFWHAANKIINMQASEDIRLSVPM
jgi:hypothetical protein